MTPDEASFKAGAFKASLVRFANGFALLERDAAGKTIVFGAADSLQYLQSALEVVDIDGDGEAEERLVHWINIRLGGNYDERPHVRKIVAVEDGHDVVTYHTDDGRKVQCFDVDEGYHGAARDELEAWHKVRNDDPDLYEAIGQGLLQQSLALID